MEREKNEQTHAFLGDMKGGGRKGSGRKDEGERREKGERKVGKRRENTIPILYTKSCPCLSKSTTHISRTGPMLVICSITWRKLPVSLAVVDS